MYATDDFLSSCSVFVVSKYRKQGVPGGDDKAR